MTEKPDYTEGVKIAQRGEWQALRQWFASVAFRTDCKPLMRLALWCAALRGKWRGPLVVAAYAVAHLDHNRPGAWCRMRCDGGGVVRDRAIRAALAIMRRERVLYSVRQTYGIERIRETQRGKLLRLEPYRRAGEHWPDE
jgi:hypothetical protein